MLKSQALISQLEVRFTNSEKDKAESNEKRETSDIYVHFIDILFAVVIGQSFVLLNSKEGFGSWLTQPMENAFGIATLLVVYGLVITSWVGYHRSTRVYPIKNPLRFVIDVTLLFIYYMGFVNAGNFGLVTWIFFFAFLLYTVWDAFRILEYHSQKSLTRDLLKRLLISAVFTIGFLAVAEVYAIMGTEITGIEWAFFVVILVMLILYRYSKWYKESKHVE